MVLQLVVKAFNYVLPSEFYPHVGIAAFALWIIYIFAQGRKTERERDLHARTIVVTGAFSPLGMTLIQSLASRGASIIAICQYDLSHAQPSLIIPLLRSTTDNPNIFAEHADLSSPASIRELCTRFLSGEKQRIDAIVFAHEYAGIGSWFRSSSWATQRREEGSLATFMMITHLLPALLVAPVERDIRIINVVNPFYAAAIPSFISKLTSAFSEEEETVTDAKSKTKESVFVSEGERALRVAVFSRHLQRILDALPNRAPALEGVAAASKTKPKHSNITAVSVSPGLNRSETVGPLLNANTHDIDANWSHLGVMMYMCLYPIVWLLSKSHKASMQSILHTLFLPTPFKQIMFQLDAAADPSSTTSTAPQAKPSLVEDTTPEELLKPGALYRECSVVKVDVPALPEDFMKERNASEKLFVKQGKKKTNGQEDTEPIEIKDDGEMGGEAVGRTVWEWYEMKLKGWESWEKEEYPERYEKKEVPAQAETTQSGATEEKK